MDRKRDMERKRKVVLDRIERIEDEMTKGREYLESGEHADWPGFRPWFFTKVRGGKVLPPHKDWVEHVFLRRRERALRQAEKVLEMLG